MSNPLDVQEFLAGFLAEADEHLRTASQNILALDQSLARGESNPRAVRSMFRSLHTIKGLSAMVGAEPIVDVAHAMETVLRAADRAPGSLTRGALEPLLQGLRRIEAGVASLASGKPLPPAPRALLESLAALQPAVAGAPSATARLAKAGAVLVGKANMHEFAIGATTENPFYGTCHNPWKFDHIPGGSSGGSAAAVAAGLGLASLGSCTGGSIRIPAAFCGVVGLKPTYGVVPRTGIVPNSSSLDHGGPMTRTAADAAHPADCTSDSTVGRSAMSSSTGRNSRSVRARPISRRASLAGPAGLPVGVRAGGGGDQAQPG